MTTFISHNNAHVLQTTLKFAIKLFIGSKYNLFTMLTDIYFFLLTGLVAKGKSFSLLINILYKST